MVHPSVHAHYLSAVSERPADSLHLLSMGSDSSLWIEADGTFFNRQIVDDQRQPNVSWSIRLRGPIYLRRLQKSILTKARRLSRFLEGRWDGRAHVGGLYAGRR